MGKINSISFLYYRWLLERALNRITKDLLLFGRDGEETVYGNPGFIAVSFNHIFHIGKEPEWRVWNIRTLSYYLIEQLQFTNHMFKEIDFMTENPEQKGTQLFLSMQFEQSDQTFTTSISSQIKRLINGIYITLERNRKYVSKPLGEGKVFKGGRNDPPTTSPSKESPKGQK